MSEDIHPIHSQPALMKVERQQEGWARSLSVPEKAVLTCSTNFSARSMLLRDFRGPLLEGGKQSPPHRDRNYVEWETAPAEAAEATEFTWIGGSGVRPAAPSYPHTGARLLINGKVALEFPLGKPAEWSVRQGDIQLCFEPRRWRSHVDDTDRILGLEGATGIYRLQVPARLLQEGQALQLRIELLPPVQTAESFLFISPRADALRVDLQTVREELSQLQRDMVQMKQLNQMLYAQVYPRLFPQLLPGERQVIYLEEHRHLHPASITALRDDELIVTMREASEHLDIEGRIVAVRSRDGGRTWSPREILFDLGNSDHRSSPIFELENGDWVTTDYRAGGEYTTDAVWSATTSVHGPTLWVAWSSDRGKTWSFTDEPLTVPGAYFPYAEAERHMIQLPSGRLLIAANYVATPADGSVPDWSVYAVVIFASDDNGRHWSVQSTLPEHPHLIGEPTLLRNSAGRILLLGRTHPGGQGSLDKGGLMQCDSDDDGVTWGDWRYTGMSSMESPGHLLQLQDGRILCTHGSRAFPRAVYVTVSPDGGATWDTANTRIVANDLVNEDTCYPTSAQTQDGTIVTVWYNNMFEKFFIGALRYRPEEI